MRARGEPLAWLGLVLSLVGIAISAYLTAAHYTGAPLACVTTGVIDCGAVTSSSFSLIPGTTVPIAALGVLWFAAMAALFAIAGFAAEPATLAVVQLAFATAALLGVLYLVHAEIVVINRVCEWCTLVHVIVLAIFFITLRRWQTSVEV